MRVFLYFLVGVLVALPTFAQQPNSPEARLLGFEYYTGPSGFSTLFFGYTTAPGPYSFVIQPGNGQLFAYIEGMPGMPAALFGCLGAPTPGWTTIPGGIVDLGPSQLQIIWQGMIGTIGSTAVGIGYVSATSPPIGTSQTFQGIVADPTTSVGYKLTAAVHVTRPQ